eukprot:jgi/Bigna1/71757/fgenesh1_pg.17_\
MEDGKGAYSKTTSNSTHHSSSVLRHVLVVGGGGLASEILLHIVGANPRSITIFDNSKVTIRDLACNSLLHHSDLGARRSEVLVARLKEISIASTYFSAHVGDLCYEFLLNFDVVIMAGSFSRSELERVNSFCRHRRKIDSQGKIMESPISFIAADTRGVMGYVMVDFGNIFHVPYPMAFHENFETEVLSIEEEEKGKDKFILTTKDNFPVNMKSGDKVLLINMQEEVRGLDGKVVSVELLSNRTARFHTTSIKLLSSGSKKVFGVLRYQKDPVSLKFNSIRRRWRAGIGLKEKSAQVQLAYQAVLAFEHNTNRKPARSQYPDAKRVLNLAEKLNDRQRRVAMGRAGVGVIDENVIQSLSLLSGVEMSSMCSIVAALAAGALIKFKKGLKPPISDAYIHYMECLPSNFVSKFKGSTKGEKAGGGGDMKESTILQPPPQPEQQNPNDQVSLEDHVASHREGKRPEKKKKADDASSSLDDDGKVKEAEFGVFLVVAEESIPVYSLPSFDAPRAERGGGGGGKTINAGEIIEASPVAGTSWVKHMQEKRYLPSVINGKKVLLKLQDMDSAEKRRNQTICQKGSEPFGLDVQQQLGQLRVLVIGNGTPAYCILKELSRIGVGTNKEGGGGIVVADFMQEHNLSSTTNSGGGGGGGGGGCVSSVIVIRYHPTNSCGKEVSSLACALASSHGQSSSYDVVIGAFGEVEEMNPMDEITLLWLSHGVNQLASKLTMMLKVDHTGTSALIDLRGGGGGEGGGTRKKEKLNDEASSSSSSAAAAATTTTTTSTSVLGSMWSTAYCPSSLMDCLSFACGQHNKLFFSGPAAARRCVVDGLSTALGCELLPKNANYDYGNKVKDSNGEEKEEEGRGGGGGSDSKSHDDGDKKDQEDEVKKQEKKSKEKYDHHHHHHHHHHPLVVSQMKQCLEILQRHKRLTSFSACIKEAVSISGQLFISGVVASRKSLSKVFFSDVQMFSWRAGMAKEVHINVGDNNNNNNNTAQKHHCAEGNKEEKKENTSSSSSSIFGRVPWSIVMALEFPATTLRGKGAAVAWLMTFGQQEQGGLQCLLENEEYLVIGCWGGGKIRHKLNATTKKKKGQKYSITCTWDGKSFSLYVNGEHVESKEEGMAFNLRSSLLTICTAPNLKEAACRAACTQHVRVLKRCLSPSEAIKAHRIAHIRWPCFSSITPLEKPSPKDDDDPILYDFIMSTARLLSYVHHVNTPGDKEQFKTGDEVKQLIKDILKEEQDNCTNTDSTQEENDVDSPELSPIVCALSNSSLSEENQQKIETRLNQISKTSSDMIASLTDILDDTNKTLTSQKKVSSASLSSSSNASVKLQECNEEENSCSDGKSILKSLDFLDPDTRELQARFVASAANLRARNFGLGCIETEKLICFFEGLNGPVPAAAGAAGMATMKLVEIAAKISARDDDDYEEEKEDDAILSPTSSLTHTLSLVT